MSGVWGSVEVNNIELPVFLGQTEEDFLTAWRNVDAAVQKNYWKLGAIAVRLERATGGRPGCRHAKSETAIQQFCKKVGIGRNTFQRYKRTYATFAETCTSGGTRFIYQLSFKHHEVAARFFDVTEDAAVAVAEACDRKWSANELERQLTAGVRREQGPKPFYPDAALRVLQGQLQRLGDSIKRWPFFAQQTRVPGMLRRLADDIERSLPPDPDVHYIRDVEEFSDDPPPQVEALT